MSNFDFISAIHAANAVIDEGSTPVYSPEFLAGQYAYESAAEMKGSKYCEARDFAAHLDRLAAAGAIFDRASAESDAATFAPAHRPTRTLGLFGKC